MTEPDIIVNGQQLTTAQAMTVRVALASFDPECGDDGHGIAMRDLYKRHADEVFRIMLGKPPSSPDKLSPHPHP